MKNLITLLNQGMGVAAVATDKDGHDAFLHGLRYAEINKIWEFDQMVVSDNKPYIVDTTVRRVEFVPLFQPTKKPESRFKHWLRKIVYRWNKWRNRI